MCKGLEERFWEKVQRGAPDECWPWLAGVDDRGYGRFYMKDDKGKKQNARAHRVSFFLTHGHWPKVGRHRCDNTVCCNPGHVQDGTQLDNLADMHERGRHVPRLKLSVAIMRRIRHMPGRAVDIAKRFNVCKDTIDKIRAGHRDRHLHV